MHVLHCNWSRLYIRFNTSCSWVPECAKVLMDSKQHWTHLVPVNEGDSASLIQKFFSCVSALMSIQLRSLVLNSLKDFLEFLKMYEVSSCNIATF